MPPSRSVVRGIGVPRPNRTYLPAVSLDPNVRLVLTSGAVGTDADGDLAGDDVNAQTHQAFDNLEAVLAAAGAGLADVIKMTAFLAPEADLEDFSRARNERLASATYASTTVRCRLNLPDALVEVEVVAAIREGDVSG